MTAVMGDNRYGKTGIRLVTVARRPDRHDLRDLTVDVRLEGDFAAVHTAGDNAPVLPTDTMRTTVYALARELGVGVLEQFGLALARHFLDHAPAAQRAEVHLVEAVWDRIMVDGTASGHAFAGGDGSRRTTTLSADRDRDRVQVESGVADLRLLKTAASGFSGFLRDDYTVLEETDDRILATAMTARWSYAHPDVDFDACWADVRSVLATAFAEHHSASVQHTLWVLGQAVLDARPEIEHIHFRMPNLHHLLVDLEPFGLHNDGEVYHVTDRPYGLIEGTVCRDHTRR